MGSLQTTLAARSETVSTTFNGCYFLTFFTQAFITHLPSLEEKFLLPNLPKDLVVSGRPTSVYGAHLWFPASLEARIIPCHETLVSRQESSGQMRSH